MAAQLPSEALFSQMEQPGTSTHSQETTSLRTPLATVLALEAGCAMVSAGLVAPLIAIVDRAIFSNASGKQPLMQAVLAGLTSLATRPLHFVRQPAFLLIYGVYGGTYIAANATQAICDRREVPWQLPKFVSSCVANVSLCVLKDLYFTRAFGTGPPRAVSPASYALYTVRDCITIFSSFHMPPVVAAELQKEAGLTPKSAETIAQLATPCAAQLASTPLHLLGMDLYNRPSTSSFAASTSAGPSSSSARVSASAAKSLPVAAGSVSWGERAAFIRREYAITAAARIARIFPAFGIGGVTNTYLRSHMYRWLEATPCTSLEP